MEVTPVLENGAPKMVDGKMLFKVDGQEKPLDLANLLDTAGKFESVSQRADRLAREAGEAGKIAEAFKPFGDPKSLTEKLAKLRQLEDDAAAGKLGKSSEEIDAEVERRAGRREASLNAQLEAAKKAAEEHQRTAAEKAGLLKKRTIEGGFAAVLASTPDFIGTPGATRTLMLLVNDEWDEENGEPVKYQKPHDPSSGVVYGADGKTPLTQAEWFNSLRKDYSNFFRAKADGGGANGNNGRDVGSKTMPIAQFLALPPEEQQKRVDEGFKFTD